MFFISILIFGVVSILNLPIELTPNFEYPELTVTVSWPNVSPEAVESYLTSPIESELSTIEGVKKISSISSEGLSEIHIEIHPTIDINFIRVEINEKILTLRNSLPQGISTPLISSYVPDDFKKLQGFLTYAITGNETSNYIRKYLNDNVILKLKNIEGVSAVEIFGGSNRLIEIIINYEKAKLLEISEDEIEKAVNEIEKYLSVGKIEKRGNQIFINIKNRITNPNEIANQVVKYLSNGNAICIKDIATINDDFEEQQFFYRINGKETVRLIISKEPNINTFKVAKAVQNKINEIATSLPKDFIITKEIDRSEDINKDLIEIYKDGFYSILIIMAVIFFLFRNIKYSFIIFCSLIFSLSSAFAFFYFFDVSLNIITFASLVIGFGFIVDNSIVVLDYVDKYPFKESTKKITVLLKNIFTPLFISTFTILVVFIPLLFLESEFKYYFQQFTIGILFTLLSSLIVSFIVIPQLYIKFFKSNFINKIKLNRVTIVQKIFDRIFFTVNKKKKIIILFLIFCIGVPTWLIPDNIDNPTFAEFYNSIFDSEFYQEIKPKVNYLLGGVINLYFNHIPRGEFWNYDEKTFLLVRLDLPNGNKIETINNLSKKIENEILPYKNNFENLITNVNNANTAIIKIEFSPEQSQTVFPYLLKNYLSNYVSNLGGVDTYVIGFGPGFSTGGGNTTSNFITEIRGFNYEKVKSIAENFSKILVKNPRVVNVDINKSKIYWESDIYEMIGTLKRERLITYGISVQNLLSIIAKTTSGNVSYNHFNILNDAVKYQIKFSNYRNIQLDELKNLIIITKDKEMIKVGELINFEEKKVLSSIYREDQQYIRLVSFDFKGPYKFGNQLLKSAIEKIKLPEGYTINEKDFKFNFSENEESKLWMLILISLLLIYLFLVAFFESFSKPFMILVTVPFSIIGAIFFIWLTDSTIERGAFAGLFLLIGLSASNSILLLDSLSKIKNKSEIIVAVRNRLRAISATTFTTFGAMLPFLINTKTIFWKSLAITSTGGILGSFLFMIFILPIFYGIFFLRKKS